MWLLLIGIIVQLGVLFPLILVLQSPPERTEAEARKSFPGVAKRLVLLLGDRARLRPDAAHASLDFGPNFFQWNAMAALLSGSPDHWVPPRGADVVLEPEALVYVGPRSLFRRIHMRREPLGQVYEEVPERGQSSLAFNYIFDVVKACSTNDTYRKATAGKTLFIFCCSSEIFNKKKAQLKISDRYLKNLDELERLMSRTYPDNMTQYILLPDVTCSEKEVNVIQMWGYQVAKGYYPPLLLQDVCPLIAFSLGLNLPIYSKGIFPDKFLKMDAYNRAICLSTNAIHLHNLAFGNLKMQSQGILQKLKSIEAYDETEKEAKIVSHLSIEKLQSSRGKLHISIYVPCCITLIGWMFVIVTEINVKYVGERFPPKKVILVMASAIVIIACIINILLLQLLSQDNLYYIFFCNLPTIPISILVLRYRVVLRLWKDQESFLPLLYVPLLVVISETALMSFSGGFRASLVLSLIPIVCVFSFFKDAPNIYLAGWVFLSYCICLFLILPPLGSLYTLEMINVSGTVWMCLGGASLLFVTGQPDKILAMFLILCLSLAIILAALSLVLTSHLHSIRICSWFLLTALFYPLIGRRRYQERLIHSALASAIPIVLLAQGLELLSYAFLLVYANCWIFLERAQLKKSLRHGHHIRRGFLLIITFVIAYLLMGKFEYDKFFKRGKMYLFTEEFDHTYYIVFEALRHVVISVTIMMVFVSLIEYKSPSDCSFLYCYIIAEMMCLRRLAQFYHFGGNISEEIFNHVIINSFTVILVIAYSLGSVMSGPFSEKKKEQISPSISQQNPT